MGFWRQSVLAALGAASLAPAVQAEVKEIISRGRWALYAGEDVSGTSVCVASTAGAEIYMGVKVYDRQNHVTIHFAKTGWSIPRGTNVRLAFQFDGVAPWTGTGYSVNNDKVLETTIPLASITSFSRQFRSAQRMVVYFPDGSEQPWRINMTGSRFIMDAFSKCVAVLQAKSKPTQPFNGPTQPGPPGGTQPFNAPPAPPSTDPTPPPDRENGDPPAALPPATRI